jgi:hypothetical protein
METNATKAGIKPVGVRPHLPASLITGSNETEKNAVPPSRTDGSPGKDSKGKRGREEATRPILQRSSQKNII